jgi:hypothetical protein
MITKLPNRAIQSKPSAWIVTNNQKDKSKPSDRGRKSIKNGKVYLKDGQEFEIELHNPLQECVLCDIKLNGQSISKNGLVLKPGERFYLDCFIDDKKKFIFKTYEVESSEESEKAIEKNGLLEVFFYKESTLTIKDWKTRFDRVIIERHQVYYPYYPYYPYWPYRPMPTIIYGSETTNIGKDSGVLNNVTTNTVNNNIIYGSETTNIGKDSGVLNNVTTNTVNNNSLYTRNLNVSNFSGNLTSISGSIETGRVEKGTPSSQKFTEIDMDFDNNYIASTIIQILPESRKPVETKDIKKTNLKNTLNSESDEVIDLIKKLADLHSAGILTDEEFNTKKAELLSKI